MDVRPVVLAGPNGAGKTNLLEAVSFLVPGRGLRSARLSEVGRRDASGRAWAVAARVRSWLGEADLGTGLDLGADGRERRVVRVDGETARSQTALAERFNAVWLTPQMDRLFVEGAGARRRFLDRLVFGFDPAHAGRVSAYEHALRERTRLLRDGIADARWLTALEETMATRGVAVTAARRDMCERLDAACAAAAGPFPAAQVALAGEVADWLAAGPALDAENRLRELLAAGRSEDGAVPGPHRDDLVVRLRDGGMPAEQCSTGQQKALLISLVLGNTRLMAAERGASPVLLLDEVAAHLDGARRAALFDEILMLGAQAWLTGTDAPVFDRLRGQAQFFRVADGVTSAADDSQ